jgi:hypothetical protein
MIVATGNRRLIVVESGIVALLLIVISALIRPDVAAVLSLAIGAIVTLVTGYLGGDAYIKGKNNSEVKTNVQ